jgi:hypothetical protein
VPSLVGRVADYQQIRQAREQTTSPLPPLSRLDRHALGTIAEMVDNRESTAFRQPDGEALLHSLRLLSQTVWRPPHSDDWVPEEPEAPLAPQEEERPEPKEDIADIPPELKPAKKLTLLRRAYAVFFCARRTSPEEALRTALNSPAVAITSTLNVPAQALQAPPSQTVPQCGADTSAPSRKSRDGSTWKMKNYFFKKGRRGSKLTTLAPRQSMISTAQVTINSDRRVGELALATERVREGVLKKQMWMRETIGS